MTTSIAYFRNLRRQLCTLSQVVHLTDEPLEWLMKHMGHTASVHQEFYRLHTDALEKVKVSKLLMLAEDGKLGDVRGMTIDEILNEGLLVTNVV